MCGYAARHAFSMRFQGDRRQSAFAYDWIFLTQLALLKEHAAKSSADTALVVFFSIRLITGFDPVTMFPDRDCDHEGRR
jgi:hypothetical protein